MQDNRNCQHNSQERGTVCIDTMRVLDSCRDRDCFENARVYLTAFGEELIASAANVRTKSAKTLWAYVGVDEVPFNCGFFRVSVKYYIELDLEACMGINRSQCFKGLAILEKDVVLYGGEGNITSYSSSPDNSYCLIGDTDTVSNNAPTAIVESVEPVVLATKVMDCDCGCNCCDCNDIPERVRCCIGGDICNTNDGPKLYVSFGIFSVIRIVRPAQLLVQATDYSVPEKECYPATSNDSPCDLFRNMSFPTSRFQVTTCPTTDDNRRGGGCGCNKG